MVDTSKVKQRRVDDGGFMCILALRAAQFWNFVDRRQIDAYAISIVILFGTMRITDWAMAFADLHPDKPGLDIAAIVSAVMVPWTALQTASVKWLFDAREKTFLPKE